MIHRHPEKMIADMCGELLHEMLTINSLYPGSICNCHYQATGPGLEEFGESEYWIEVLRTKSRVIRDIECDPIEFFGYIDLRPVLKSITDGVNPNTDSHQTISPYTRLLHSIVTTKYRTRTIMADICRLSLQEFEHLVTFCRNNMNLTMVLAHCIKSSHICLSSEMINIIGTTLESVQKAVNMQSVFMDLQFIKGDIIRLTNGLKIDGISWGRPNLTAGRRAAYYDEKLWNLIAEFLNAQESSPLALEDDPKEMFVQIARLVQNTYRSERKPGSLLLSVIRDIKNYDVTDASRDGCGIRPTLYARRLAYKIFLTIEVIR